MHRVLSRRFHRITWRMFIFLIISTVLTTGNSMGRGAAAANSLKYVHHSPLASALSGRSGHDNGDKAGNGVISSRSDNIIDGPSTSSSNNLGVDGGGGGGGEVLLPKTFPLGPQEPTCEQLRAMWIFSKRQSRAAEITNEIPTYRDPFAYNVWEPYYSTTRSMGGVRMVPRFGERSRSPVFGRVISREPLLPQRINLGQRQRHMGVGSSSSSESSQTRFFGAESKTSSAASGGRRTSQYRHVGANGPTANSAANNGGQANSVAVHGSFQKLKELIWTERAKELTEQRRAEEMAARAAVLKEIANGQNVQAPYKPIFKSESHLMDENRSPDRDIYEQMNDDHRAGSIASGQSQALITSRALKNQNNNNNMKNIGTPRSYAYKGQKSSSMFSNSNADRPGRHILPSMIPSSYTMDDTGILKAYPMRPSHFRERNRSLFKQNSPSDYFQRDIREKTAYEDEEAIAGNLVFERLVNELNHRILAKQQESEASRTPIYAEENPQGENIRNFLDDSPLMVYEDETPTAGDLYTGLQELLEYY